MKFSVRRIFVLLTLLSFVGFAHADELTVNGAGATFPYPIYARWGYDYAKSTGVKINYQSIGSGGGIAQIKAGTVDFGASDAPLSAKELEEAGLYQFPLIIGGVVPVVNLPGIKAGEIKLSPEALAGIFLGTITNWNDPILAKDNAGVALPDKAITVVHRADGSGTSWIFTNYLAKVSPDWQSKVGAGKEVAWPAGVGGKGNEGVAAYVQRIAGAIGYVEYAYAEQNKMTSTQLKNHDGAFVAPTMDNFQAAAASADWVNTPGFAVVLIDQPGAQSWPITGASFILLHKDQKNPAQAKAMLGFFDWALANGSASAKELNYVPMPETVAKLARDGWTKAIKLGQ